MILFLLLIDKKMNQYKASNFSGQDLTMGLINHIISYFHDHIIRKILKTIYTVVLPLWVMPLGINATVLTLIPKTPTTQTMKDYRPIACCNLLYKVISEVLANKLNVILPNAVEAIQCAFISE